ncbi:hypothetical protein [Chthoniobacter flavus]|nr:hypothetical protein [Chthoniobacter flavus]
MKAHPPLDFLDGGEGGIDSTVRTVGPPPVHGDFHECAEQRAGPPDFT